MLKFIKFSILFYFMLTGNESRRVSLIKLKSRKLYVLEVNPLPQFNPIETSGGIIDNCDKLKCDNNIQCKIGKCYMDKDCGHKICHVDSVPAHTTFTADEDTTPIIKNNTVDESTITTTSEAVFSEETLGAHNHDNTTIINYDTPYLSKLSTLETVTPVGITPTNVTTTVTIEGSTIFNATKMHGTSTLSSISFGNKYGSTTTKINMVDTVTEVTPAYSVSSNATTAIYISTIPQNVSTTRETTLFNDVGSGSGSGDQENDKLLIKYSSLLPYEFTYSTTTQEDFGNESGSGSGSGGGSGFIPVNDNENEAHLDRTITSDDFTFIDDDEIPAISSNIFTITPANSNAKKSIEEKQTAGNKKRVAVTDDNLFISTPMPTATKNIASIAAYVASVMIPTKTEASYNDDEDFYYSGSGDKDLEATDIPQIRFTSLSNTRQDQIQTETMINNKENGRTVIEEKEESFDELLSPEDIEAEIGIAADDYYVIIDGHEFTPAETESLSKEAAISTINPLGNEKL